MYPQAGPFGSRDEHPYDWLKFSIPPTDPKAKHPGRQTYLALCARSLSLQGLPREGILFRVIVALRMQVARSCYQVRISKYCIYRVMPHDTHVSPMVLSHALSCFPGGNRPVGRSIFGLNNPVPSGTFHSFDFGLRI